MLKVLSSKDRFVPLKNVSVEVEICSFAAEVCIKQVFINSEVTSNAIEAVYCFPVEEQAAIFHFEAIIDDGRKIEAEIKEKKQAQREYGRALQQGHGAYLLEQDEKSNDIFTISVGSLQPQSKCEIQIRYVQELDLINDGQRIQFVVPTVIAPRYSSISAGDGHVKSPGSTNSKYVQSAPYSISFTCSISSLPVASITSPSHRIVLHTPTKVSLTEENTHLDRDITLHIDLQQQQTLTHTLVEKQAVMVSLVPTLQSCKRNNDEKEHINCEYIFIVDCSRSMAEANKIGYARQAMSIFLQSLPVESSFNIFRFGSSYEQCHQNAMTVKYNEQNAKTARKYVKHMQADLGGTELHSVLSYLHQNQPQANNSRQIFLLTDGEISDVDAVLRLCHSMRNSSRIFSFGLGSSPSRALVKGLARMTNGSYIFIPPNTHVDVAVAKQLEKALEPCLLNLRIQCHFNDPELNEYRISPKLLPPIHAHQRLNVYMMLPKNIEGTLSGSIEFLTNEDQLLERVQFTNTQPFSSLLATRLAAKSIIADLQTEDYDSSTSSTRQARFIQAQKVDKKQEVINISIQHQVLSPFTAFIAIEKRTKEEISAAAPGEMILREVPLESRANVSTLQSPSRCMSTDENDEDEEEEDVSLYSHVSLDEELFSLRASTKYKRSCNSPMRRRRSRSRSRRRSRSRSCSRDRRRASSSSTDSEGEIRPQASDSIRQFIALQSFDGLWSIKNLQTIISLARETTSADLEKILREDPEQNQDVVLSMIILLIFTKYYMDKESLWKPIIKKCSKAIEDRLGNTEYLKLTEKVKLLI